MTGEAIFIGYRRDDTADVAGRIYDAMALRFGKGRVFKDVDNIGPGVDFGDYIKSVLPKCRVALVLIGPHWLESKDEDGNRRLDDEHDWVRTEIETALSTPDVLTVPVLVNGARMPRAADVPESLRPLLRRNAAIIRRDPDFHDDVERLAAALRASVNTGILDLSKIGGQSSAAGSAPRARSTSRAPMMIAAAVALLAAGYGAWRFLPGALSPPPVEQVVDGASESDAASDASEPAALPTPAESTPDVTQERPNQQQRTTAPPTQSAAVTAPAPRQLPYVGRYVVDIDYSNYGGEYDISQTLLEIRGDGTWSIGAVRVKDSLPGLILRTGVSGRWDIITDTGAINLDIPGGPYDADLTLSDRFGGPSRLEGCLWTMGEPCNRAVAHRQ